MRHRRLKGWDKRVILTHFAVIYAVAYIAFPRLFMLDENK